MTSKELKNEILKERSTNHWQTIIKAVHQSPALLSNLISYTYDADDRLSFHASWIMDKCIEQQPQLLHQKQVSRIVKSVLRHSNQSVIRTSLRLLSRQKLPKSVLGSLVDQCFKWLMSNKSDIAVKVHAMQILCNVTLEKTALKNELIMVIEDQMPQESAGFRARAKMVLKKLKNS